MKLLFAIKRLNSAAGGAERVLCDICSELANRGHDVTIVTFDHPGGDPFYPLDGSVKRIDLGIGDSSRSARLVETLSRITALRRIVKREAPQVAIGFMHSMFVPLALAMIGTGIPVVGSEHIVPEHYRTRPLQYALLIAVSPLLSKVTVLSASIRSRYPAVLRKRMIVMPNPVISANGRAKPSIEKANHILLNVARLDVQKDHNTLLHAFAQIADSYPTWKLKIIGDGPLHCELNYLICGLGLTQRVHMSGVTANIGAEYLAADAFVISSRYEAFGLVTAEAMSYGLPVVGFADCPGTNELIQNDKTGLLAPAGPDRAMLLARQLERILADSNLRKRLGEAGSAAIEDCFSSRHVGDLWESLLKSPYAKV